MNNAGILLDDDKDILTMTSEIFETTLRTDTLGALLVSQEFVLRPGSEHNSTRARESAELPSALWPDTVRTGVSLRCAAEIG